MSAFPNRQPEPAVDGDPPRSAGLAPQDAMRFAVANTVLEGAVVAPETEHALQKWAAGELTDDELVEFGRSTFGPRR